MRAAVMTNWELRVDSVADQQPQLGQLLARVPRAFDDLGRPAEHAKILVESR